MAGSPPRRRLDRELVRRGLVSSRAEAQEAIEAGLVTVDGAPGLKAATQVHHQQDVVLLEPPRRYVSRGGEKLEHGLDAFEVDPAGLVCLDAGVSTGGFTDCLLQRGAAVVYAYDVGYGQVHDRIRRDSRVVVRERTNVRDLVPADLPGPAPALTVCDVSFIALTTVLPVLRALSDPGGEAVVLVKPQFEATREDVGKGGVVRDPEVWRRVVTGVAEAARRLGWPCGGVVASPLTGPAGNVEFLVHLEPDGTGDCSGAIDAAIEAGVRLRQ